MSTLVVEVCEVKAVYPHPQADALEFITVKGWQVIVQKALGLKKAALFCRFGVESVPHLYGGPFSWGVVEEHTYGPTTMCLPDTAGRFGGREGCVVTPVVERYDPGLGGGGRVILKSISADYLARKGGTDEH